VHDDDPAFHQGANEVGEVNIPMPRMDYSTDKKGSEVFHSGQPCTGDSWVAENTPGGSSLYSLTFHPTTSARGV
jgi:hypothetical protein